MTNDQWQKTGRQYGAEKRGNAKVAADAASASKGRRRRAGPAHLEGTI
jgi:hypothetical protein